MAKLRAITPAIAKDRPAGGASRRRVPAARPARRSSCFLARPSPLSKSESTTCAIPHGMSRLCGTRARSCNPRQPERCPATRIRRFIECRFGPDSPVLWGGPRTGLAPGSHRARTGGGHAPGLKGASLAERPQRSRCPQPRWERTDRLAPSPVRAIVGKARFRQEPRRLAGPCPVRSRPAPPTDGHRSGQGNQRKVDQYHESPGIAALGAGMGLSLPLSAAFAADRVERMPVPRGCHHVKEPRPSRPGHIAQEAGARRVARACQSFPPGFRGHAAALQRARSQGPAAWEKSVRNTRSPARTPHRQAGRRTCAKFEKV